MRLSGTLLVCEKGKMIKLTARLRNMSKPTQYLYVGFFLFFLFMIIGNIWYWQDAWRTKGFGLKQQTSDWAQWQSKLPPSTDVSHLYVSPEISNNLRPGILLRYAENNNVLLLKHTIGEGIYSFNPNLYKTEKSSEKEWLDAQGKITVCHDQRWSRQQVFNVDNHNYKLLSWGDNPVIYESYGKYALDAVVSPTKTKVAILSAYGPKKPFFKIGFIFGGPDDKIYGQRYIQIMDLDTKEYIGKPVKLYSEAKLACFSSCWSSDEKILVAYECNYSNFQIVEPFRNSEK
ncbi:MAG TPA: hypothetical protein VF540_04785 [Segetibacter sp.]